MSRAAWRLAVAVCLVVMCVGTVAASVPRLINYQGILTEPSGVPVADGAYDISFAIYNAELGGAPLWTEVQTAQVRHHSGYLFQYAGVPVHLLLQGGQRLHQLSVQGAQARVRDATVASRLRAVRAEVVMIYHRAQAQQATLGVEEELLEGRHLDLALTRRMYDLAGASRVEVLAAELNVQRQEQRIQQTLARLQQWILSLRRTIGDPGLDGFSLSDVAPEPFDPSGLDADALVARAQASSPLVQQQIAQLDMGGAQAKAARGSRWPTLSMSFGFTQRTFAQERDALFDLYPDQARYGSSSLSLRIPLFSRFQTSARVAEATSMAAIHLPD